MSLDAPGTASLLVPWRVERILRDDDDFLVVDKPAGVVVHGGDEARHDDLVHRLQSWLEAQGRDGYLGVHQRLDQATSGVLLFTRSKTINPAVAQAMDGHEIRRTYCAVVRPGASLARRGRLEHRLEHRRGRTEVVTRGGKRAVTEYEVLERRGERALVRLVPVTGRTHQLRAQLAAVGAPICGDRLYGGERAPRLMLHAQTLAGGPLGGEVTSLTPEQLGEWLETGSLRVPADPRGLLRDAGLLRFALRGVTSAYRLVNGAADLMPGVVIDVYGAWAVLSLYDADALARAHDLAQALVEHGFAGVYSKVRVRADLRQRAAASLAPTTPLCGEPCPHELVVEEHGMRLAVALDDGLSTGLFVDQRDNRQRVRTFAAGGRVLNLFSYTCSFSVAAALGGATEVVSIDLAGRALERGRRNFELNALPVERHRFFKDDAVKWLARAARRGERFRLIVLDPPSFATVGKGTFSVEKGYGEVAAAALRLLEPGGRLLAVTNHAKTTPAGLRKILQGALARAGRKGTALRAAPSGLDCPDGPDGPWPSKSVWVTVE